MNPKVVVLFLILFCEGYIFSQSCTTPLNISNNTVSDEDPQASGDYIVWSNDDGVYLYRMSTNGPLINISANATTEANPQINGDYVVWQGSDGDTEIFLYNIITMAPATNISDNGLDDARPQIYGDYVVWQGNDGMDSEIYLYQISTNSSPLNISDNSSADRDPQIDGDYVVWQGNDGMDNEIYLYQISTMSTPLNISDNTSGDEDPAIDGNYVVWENSLDQVYLYNIDLSSSIPILPMGVEDPWNASISGNNVIYEGEEVSESDQEIFLYLIEEMTTTNISDNDLDDYGPYVEGDYVAWYNEKPRELDYENEIFLYCVATSGPVLNLSDDTSLDDYFPVITGSNIIWRKGRGSDSDIYISSCQACIEPVPTLSQWALIVLALSLSIIGILGLLKIKKVRLEPIRN